MLSSFGLTNRFLLKKINTSLQGNTTRNFKSNSKHNYKIIQQHKGNCTLKRKRGVCCFPSLSFAGSMTVEAALVLPLFIASMVACMLFGEMLIVEGKMHHGLCEAAKYVSSKEYYKEKKGKHVTTAEVYVIGKKYADTGTFPAAIKVKALNYAGSKIPNNASEAELHMSYILVVNLPLLGTKQTVISEVVRQKTFTGYEPSAFEKGEGYVYITKYGTVYHRSLSCYHIMLTVSGSSQVKKYLDGKKHYRACSKCAKNVDPGVTTLYIPADGDCYHTSLSCSGLTRIVRKVSIWEVGNRKPCSTCAK